MFTSFLLSVIAGLAVLCYNLKIDKASLEASVKYKEDRLSLLNSEREAVYNDYRNANEQLREQHKNEIQSLKENHLTDLERVAERSIDIVISKIEKELSKNTHGPSLSSLLSQQKTDL